VISVNKKKKDFTCFYYWIECKNCNSIYPCIPSIDKGIAYLNVPKECINCNNKIKLPENFKKIGFKINKENYAEIKGQRLLIDEESFSFPITNSIPSTSSLDISLIMSFQEFFQFNQLSNIL